MSVFSESLRNAVVQRAQSRCEYCHLPVHGQVAVFPIDHIRPRTQGGTTDLANLALACPHCNAHKWKHAVGVDEDTNQEVPLYNPRADAWSDHFAWSPDRSCQLRGTTPKGRATVAKLQMNHHNTVAARRLLMALGLFPGAVT